MPQALALTIANRITGDRIEFISSPLMGDGQTLVFRGILPPHALGAPLHSHDEMTETFTVESGALEILLSNGVIETLQAGETKTLAPDTPHGFRNALDSETCFVTTASPGEGLETFLRSMYGLANEGKVGSTGMPNNPLDLASILRRVDMQLAGIPRPLQGFLVGLLSLLSRITGIDRSHNRFVSATSEDSAVQS